jgi:hypothetical protein
MVRFLMNLRVNGAKTAIWDGFDFLRVGGGRLVCHVKVMPL